MSGASTWQGNQWSLPWHDRSLSGAALPPGEYLAEGRIFRRMYCLPVQWSGIFHNREKVSAGRQTERERMWQRHLDLLAAAAEYRVRSWLLWFHCDPHFPWWDAISERNGRISLPDSFSAVHCWSEGRSGSGVLSVPLCYPASEDPSYYHRPSRFSHPVSTVVWYHGYQLENR